MPVFERVQSGEERAVQPTTALPQEVAKRLRNVRGSDGLGHVLKNIITIRTSEKLETHDTYRANK
jgi:hypothetical protein